MNDLMTKDRFEVLDATVKKGMAFFVEVGQALMEIRDKKLYKHEFKTFAEYTQERRGITSRRAYQLIDAAGVMANLKKVKHVTHLPKNERQALALIPVPPKNRAAVMEVVVKKSNGTPITAKVIKEAAKPFKEKKKEKPKVYAAAKEKGVSTFNATNDNIEWAKWTWNPVTGCKHGCKYCYARDIAMRYTGTFKPQFHPDRLHAPKNTRIPDRHADDPGIKNVFVCSMADLFGEWVHQEWIDAVLAAVRNAPEWNFLFLTKNPERYLDITFPENSWVGATADTQERMDRANKVFGQLKRRKECPTALFVSCEPLSEEIKVQKSHFDWIIIGARSRSSKMPAKQPEWEWVDGLYISARDAGAKVYFKPNLEVRPREYPK